MWERGLGEEKPLIGIARRRLFRRLHLGRARPFAGAKFDRDRHGQRSEHRGGERRHSRRWARRGWPGRGPRAALALFDARQRSLALPPALPYGGYDWRARAFDARPLALSIPSP